MQSAMKDIVCYIYENDLNSAVYFSLQIIAVIFSHLLAALFGKKLGLQIKQAALAVMIEVAIVYIEMAVLCVLVAVITPSNIPVMNSYYNNVGRTFVLVPFSAMLISKLLKQDLKVLCSLFAVAQPTIWGLASIACIFSGCCAGIPCDWGIYNVWKQDYLIPTQLLNAILLVGVASYMVYRAKRMNYEPSGTEYPIALILIGTVRFFTEYLMDNPKIIWGLSSLSFDSIVMCIVGAVALLTIRGRESKAINEVSGTYK